MINEIIWDLETKKLFGDVEGTDPADLGVSIVSIYQRSLDKDLKEIKGKIQSFWEKDFENLWPIFSEAERIIGFNTLKFDLPALQPYAPFKLSKLNHFDIMQQVKEALGIRISLDALAKETLGREKIDIGVQAVYYWQQGGKENLKKLQRYCEDDVLITRDLYDFGLKNGYLKYKDKWNTPRKVEVDFSYPAQVLNSKQEGLF